MRLAMASGDIPAWRAVPFKYTLVTILINIVGGCSTIFNDSCTPVLAVTGVEGVGEKGAGGGGGLSAGGSPVTLIDAPQRNACHIRAATVLL